MESDEARWLHLEPRPAETLRAALERTLREAIRSGALREGVRLPASRLLADDLGVSRGVASDAYAQLEAEGFLVIRPREAPLVAAIPRLPGAPSRARTPAPAPRFDLTPTTPDLHLFPRRRWLAAALAVHRSLSPTSLGYGESQGEPLLREALADHLGRTRGVIADPAQVVVVQGTAQGVDVVLRMLTGRRATRIVVEDPSHPTVHERIRALGLELVGAAVDAEGVTLSGVIADAAVVTPAHQFPTGSVLSGRRRRELLSWARESGAVIVEDDYDSEFRYDREPVRALQGLAPDQVIHLGTVSKVLAPALRLGWLVVPAGLVDDVVHAKRLVDDFSPTLGQLTLARFLQSGDYDRHVRRARGVYRERRDGLLAALREQLPEVEVEGVAAGLHLLVWLPPGLSDTAIAARARQRGLAIVPLSAFRVTPAGRGGLVLGYASLHGAAVVSATRILAEVLHSP